LKTSNK